VPAAPRDRRWAAAQIFVIVCVLALVASTWRPRVGFTRLIGFSQEWHDRELPAVRAAPHVDETRGAYDGRFYAELAVDPLVRDPALDTALDAPTVRARRIFLPWTAWLVGLGQPARILQAYALLNVAAWLVLAWLLTRWIRVDSARRFALWAGCLLGYGALDSLRYSLTDLPATVLAAVAVVFVEQGRTVPAALVAGAAGLTRETGVLVCAAFLELRRGAGRWLTAARAVAIALAPFLLWCLYLAMTRDWRPASGLGNVGLPLRGFIWKVHDIARELRAHGVNVPVAAMTTGLLGFLAQGVVVVRAAVARRRSPWALVAATTFAFMLCTQLAPWAEVPGGYLRVCLPLAVGANVTLAGKSDTGWITIALTNLGVISALLVLRP
jgi:hypothetical protein